MKDQEQKDMTDEATKRLLDRLVAFGFVIDLRRADDL